MNAIESGTTFGPDALIFRPGEVLRDRVADGLILEIIPNQTPTSENSSEAYRYQFNITHFEYITPPTKVELQAPFATSGNLLVFETYFGNTPHWVHNGRTYGEGTGLFVFDDARLKYHRLVYEPLDRKFPPESVVGVLGNWRQHPEAVKQAIVSALSAMGVPNNQHEEIAHHFVQLVDAGLDWLKRRDEEEFKREQTARCIEETPPPRRYDQKGEWFED